MLQERVPGLSRRLSEFVEPDRVRREVYTDPAIFELEMQRIHERVWIYCGHESQVPKTGDYYAVQIGRQPMVMVRGADGKVNVLYNRCPHRGNMMVGDRQGSSGEFFRCSYHAWTFHHDGRLRSIPMMESGYSGTPYGKEHPDCSMKRAARVENYRGFVFASLAQDGPTLKEFLGESRIAFDDMCDRAPQGEVEIVPNCFRVIQKSNWKIFLENQLDALHPSVTHQSTGRAAHEVEKEIERQTGRAPLSYHMLSAFATVTIDKWDNFQTLNYPHGHCILTGYMGLRPKDPDTLAYEKTLVDAYGQKRMEEILGREHPPRAHLPGSFGAVAAAAAPRGAPARRRPHAHGDLALPTQGRARGDLSPLARLLQPRELACDAGQRRRPGKLLEMPPGTLIGGRRLGQLRAPLRPRHPNGGQVETAANCGTSEAPMRNQMKAWARYMAAQ
jgi:phenylpropionate dioxygenase-like ring-hydroxylating dioxygenase large terminal subunit